MIAQLIYKFPADFCIQRRRMAVSMHRTVLIILCGFILSLMQYMYKTLLEWSLHNNRETMKLALAALEAFLHEVRISVRCKILYTV